MAAILRTWLRVCLLVALTLGAVTAAALDAKKAALSLAKSAAGAFESGEMRTAARLYLEAFRTDASEPNYLYSAARAEQAAGQTEHADQHYREFIATPAAEKDRVARAKGYLEELAGIRADEKLEAGERFARRNDWTLAAAAYAEAARLRPDRYPLLYRAAVAANEAGDRLQAATWLRAYLEKAPKDAADRGEAQLMLDSLSRPKTAVAQQPEATKPREPVQARLTPVVAAAQKPDAPALAVTQAPEAPPSSVRRTAAWLTVGTGGAVTVVGAILLAVGKSQQSSFEQSLNVQNGKVTGTLTDHAAAVAQASAIGGRETAGAVMTGVGLAAVGAGVYLLLTSPAQRVAVMPDGRGMRVGWSF